MGDLERAHKLFKEGLLEESEALAHDILKLSPNNYRAHTIISAIHNKKQNFQTALKFAKSSVSLCSDGNNTNAFYQLAKAFFGLKDFASAHQNFDQVLRFKPDHKLALFDKASVYLACGDLTNAVSGFKLCVKKNPDLWEAWSNLGLALSGLGQHDNAEIVFKHTLQYDAKNIPAAIGLGNVLRKKGSMEEALSLFSQLVKEYPQNNVILRNRALCLRDLKRFDEAITAYEDYLKIEVSEVWRDQACNDLEMLLNLRGNNSQFLLARLEAPELLLPSDDRSPNMIALIAIGRSGSLFLQSLFSQVNNVHNVPGIYLKGLFNRENWPALGFSTNGISSDPNYSLDQFLNLYRVLFDSSINDNVPGKPMGPVRSLSKSQGLQNLGADREATGTVDVNLFYKCFLKQIANPHSLSISDFFVAIHRAFSEASAKNFNVNTDTIFYHFHNPSNVELAWFRKIYPNAKFLFSVRDTIKSIDSWSNQSLADDLKNEKFSVFNHIYDIFNRTNMPLFRSERAMLIRLESLKNNYNSCMNRIFKWSCIDAEVPQNPKSTFYDLDYWGPPTINSNLTSAFDKSNLSSDLNFFSEKDVEVLEMIFGEFIDLLGYTRRTANLVVPNHRKLDFYSHYPKLSKHSYNVDAFLRFLEVISGKSKESNIFYGELL